MPATIALTLNLPAEGAAPTVYTRVIRALCSEAGLTTAQIEALSVEERFIKAHAQLVVLVRGSVATHELQLEEEKARSEYKPPTGIT